MLRPARKGDKRQEEGVLCIEASARPRQRLSQPPHETVTHCREQENGAMWIRLRHVFQPMVAQACTPIKRPPRASARLAFR